MEQEKVVRMARNLISHSVALQPGENLLIETFDGGVELAKALIAEAQRVGGRAFLTIKSNEMIRALLLGATQEQVELTAQFELARMQKMDAYIAIRGSANSFELSDVPAEKMALYQQFYQKPVHNEERGCRAMNSPKPELFPLSAERRMIRESWPPSAHMAAPKTFRGSSHVPIMPGPPVPRDIVRSMRRAPPWPGPDAPRPRSKSDTPHHPLQRRGPLP